MGMWSGTREGSSFRTASRALPGPLHCIHSAWRRPRCHTGGSSRFTRPRVWVLPRWARSHVRLHLTGRPSRSGCDGRFVGRRTAAGGCRAVGSIARRRVVRCGVSLFAPAFSTCGPEACTVWTGGQSAELGGCCGPRTRGASRGPWRPIAEFGRLSGGPEHLVDARPPSLLQAKGLS